MKYLKRLIDIFNKYGFSHRDQRTLTASLNMRGTSISNRDNDNMMILTEMGKFPQNCYETV